MSGFLINSFIGGSALDVTPLNTVITSGMVAEWDTTSSFSYRADGTLYNIESNPADGETQDAYDMEIKAGLSFVGTEGDPAAYLNVDSKSNGYLQGTNTNFTNQLQRTDLSSPFTILFFYRTATLANNEAIFSNGRLINGAYTWSFRQDSTGDLQERVRNNLSTVQADIDLTILTASTNTMIAVTADRGQVGAEGVSVNADTFTGWTNNATAITNDQTEANFTFAGFPMLSTGLGVNTRLYSMALVNKVISDTELADARDLMEARHSRTY